MIIMMVVSLVYYISLLSRGLGSKQPNSRQLLQSEAAKKRERYSVQHGMSEQRGGVDRRWWWWWWCSGGFVRIEIGDDDGYHTLFFTAKLYFLITESWMSSIFLSSYSYPIYCNSMAFNGLLSAAWPWWRVDFCLGGRGRRWWSVVDRMVP